MAKSRKSNETENYATDSLLEKPDEQVRLPDWTSTSEATNYNQVYRNHHLLDLRVKLARLSNEVSAFTQKQKNLTSSSLNSEENKQETQKQLESIINIRVKPLLVSGKPKYFDKQWTSITQSDASGSKNEISASSEKCLSLNPKEHKEDIFDNEIKCQNLKVSENLGKRTRSRYSSLEPLNDYGTTQFTIPPNLKFETNFTRNKEESDQPLVDNQEESDKLNGNYSENSLNQTKEHTTKAVPIGNKTPILRLKDVLKQNPESDTKFNPSDLDVIENKNQTKFKRMESKNVLSKTPQQQTVVQMNKKNLAKGKINEKQVSPLTSGAVKHVGKIIKMTKDSDHGPSTKLLNIGDKKKVVILTVKKQESTVLKSSPKKDDGKIVSTQEPPKTKELPELKKYLTLNTNVANTCSDTVVSTRKEPKSSPVSNTLSPPTDRESPRQGRRIRSPSIRYTDDMIVYPLKSPRKSRDTSKTSPNGSVDQDEKSLELKTHTSKSAKKDSRKDVAKVTVPCQTSHLYSLLTGKIKQLKAENSNDNIVQDDTQESSEKSDNSVSLNAVRALKFSEKSEKNKNKSEIKDSTSSMSSSKSSMLPGKSTKISKVKVTHTISKEEDIDASIDKVVIDAKTASEESSNLDEASHGKITSVEVCGSGMSVKSDAKSLQKEKQTSPKDTGSKNVKSLNKNSKKKNSDNTLPDISVDSLDDDRTVKTKTSEVPSEAAKTESNTKSETNDFVDLIGRDVIKVNSINTKSGNSKKGNVPVGLFGLIAKLESSLTSTTELPPILTDAPYNDSILLNEEENSDQDSMDDDNDAGSKVSGYNCDRNSPNISLTNETSGTLKNTEDEKLENSIFDKPVASPDVILVDSATSSSKEEISSDKINSGKQECNLSNSGIIDKSGVPEVSVCPPDSTTNVVDSCSENVFEIITEENKEKGFISDTEDNKSGGENIGSRNLFDDFLSNIASPVKDGQKKEEKLQKDGVNTNNNGIVKKDDIENKTIETVKTESVHKSDDLSVRKEEEKSKAISDKSNETNDSKSDEEDDVIIVKVEPKKEPENKIKIIKVSSVNKSNVIEQIKKKFHIEQEETSRRTPVKEDIVYDLTEDSNSNSIQKENFDRALKSSVIRKRNPVRKITSPAPLDVLMRVEMEMTDSLSAFTSKNLDEYLKSENSESVPSVKIESTENNDMEESDDMEMELLPEFDPDFDEVDGLLFMSFTSEDALNAHVHVERKTNIGKNENLLLGMSRIKRLRQQQRQIPSRFQTKFNRLKKLKIQSKINQNLRGMHKALSKYQRLYRLQLEKVFTEKGLQLPVRPVKTLQKTADITKIKGWKNKYGNAEELAEATGLPLTKSGKIHWRTEERLLKNLNSQELKEIGLNLKKKRRKNLIFTVRKGMSKGDKTVSKSASSNYYDDDESEEEEEEYRPEVRTDDEDMNDDYWFPKYEEDKNKKSEIKVNQTKQRLAIKRLNIDPEDVEIIRKLGGAKTRVETVKEPGLGTYLSPSGRVVKRRRKRRKILHLTTMTHSMAMAALKALDPKFVKPKVEPTKTPSTSVKKENSRKLDNHSPSDAALKPCDKPGCRYGCICHLCRLGDQSSDPEVSGKSRPPSCDKEYCRLGCICDSIEKRERQRLSSHCGKPDCMFQCICGGADDLKKKLFSPNSSHSDINDSISGLDQGTDEIIPSLSSHDNSFEDVPEDRKSRRQDQKLANLPKRTPTYRLAKNLDAISRKAMLLYETSEMYTEMKARKRKSRDSSQDGLVSSNKPTSNGSTPTSRSNQLKTSFSSISGKKGTGWRSLQPGPTSPPSQTSGVKKEVFGSDHSFEIESDEEEIKEDTGTSARTTGYNPQDRKSTKKCTCSCSETHSHDHSLHHKTKLHSSGEATSPVVISPVNSRPSTPEALSASQVIKDKQASTERKHPGQILTDSLSGAAADIKVPIPKPQTIWHTQWVCLKASKKKLEEEGQSASDGVRLLEINSNCNWEVCKQKILSRISAQLSKEGYPSPKRTMVGDFCVEFLQKSNKPAVIPPEVRAKLPVSIYSVRINIMKITNINEQQNSDLNIHTMQHFIPTQEQILLNTSVPCAVSSVTGIPAVVASGTSPFKPFRISNQTRMPVKLQIAHPNEQNTVSQNSISEQGKTSPLGIPTGGISGFSQLQIKNAGQHKSLVSSHPLATQSFILNSGNPSESLLLSKSNRTLGVVNKQQNIGPISENGDNNQLAAKAMYVGSITMSNTSVTHSLTDSTSVSQTLSQSVILSPQMSTASTSVVASTGLKSSPDTGVQSISQSQEDKMHLSTTGLNISNSGGVNIGLSSTAPNIVNTSGVYMAPRPSISAGSVFISPSTTGPSGANVGTTNTGLIMNSGGVNLIPMNTGTNINSGSASIGPPVSGLNINSSVGINTGSGNPVMFKDTKLSNPRIEGLRQGLQNILKCNVAQETQKIVQILPDKDKVIGPNGLAPNVETKPPVTSAVGTMPVTIFGPFDSTMSLPTSSNVKFLKAAPVKAGNSPVIHLVPISGSQKFATHFVVSQSSPLSPMTRMTSPTQIMTRPLLTTSSSSSSIPIPSVIAPPAARELIAVPVNLTPMNMKQATSHGAPFIPISQVKNAQNITIPFKGQISILPKVKVNANSAPKVPINRASTPSSLNDVMKANSSEQSESVGSKPETEKWKKRKRQKKDGDIDEKGNTEEGKKKKKRVNKESENNTEKKKRVKKKDSSNEASKNKEDNNETTGSKKKKRKKKKDLDSEKNENNKDIKDSSENTNEEKLCETDIKNSTEIVQREITPLEGNNILFKSDKDEEPPVKRKKSVSEMTGSERKAIISSGHKHIEVENSHVIANIFPQVVVSVSCDDAFDRKTETLGNLIDNTLVSGCGKTTASLPVTSYFISKDDNNTHCNEMVTPDIDETELNDEVDSMKSSGGSSLAGKNLLQSVEIGAQEIRNIVQNVNCDGAEQENQKTESENGNVSNPKAPDFLVSFMEQDNSNSSGFQSYQGEVTETKGDGQIRTQTGKRETSDIDSCKSDKSLTKKKNVALEVVPETLGSTNQTESCDEDLTSEGVLIIDTSTSDDNMERQKCSQISTNDSAKCDQVKSQDKNSADNVKHSADLKNPNVNPGNKRDITANFKEKRTPGLISAENEHLKSNWKEVGDLGAVINISEEGLISNAKNQIFDPKARDPQSGLSHRTGQFNRDCDESGDDVEIISFDDIENNTKQKASVNSTESRKRKSIHTVREELPRYKVIKQKEDGDVRIISPGLSQGDSDEHSIRDNCSIIDDCDDNNDIINVDDDEDIDIESVTDSDSVFKQLRLQARDQSPAHNISKHSCMLHSSQMKRKRKPQLEVIHNSLQDDVEYKEGNIWIPDDPRNKEEHNDRERKRRFELADLFKKVCKILFGETDFSREASKIKILTKLRELIESSEKTYRKSQYEKKYYTNKNNALKLQLNNLKVSLRNEGVSEAVIQGHLQKVAYIVSKIITDQKVKIPGSDTDLPEKVPTQSGSMEIPVRLVPIQSSDLPNVKISNFQKISPQIANIHHGSIAISSPSSASYSSPVPVQLLSSQQVKQMAAAIHVEQDTSSSTSDKEPDIYIDYAEENYQEGVDDTATDFHMEDNKLSDIGDLPEFVYGSEKFSSIVDNNSDTNNQTLQNDSSDEKKVQMSNVTNDKAADNDLKLTSMLIESTGEIIRVELREDGQTSEQTDEDEQTTKPKMYDREKDNQFHVESNSDLQNVSELLAGTDT